MPLTRQGVPLQPTAHLSENVCCLTLQGFQRPRRKLGFTRWPLTQMWRDGSWLTDQQRTGLGNADQEIRGLSTLFTPHQNNCSCPQPKRTSLSHSCCSKPVRAPRGRAMAPSAEPQGPCPGLCCRWPVLTFLVGVFVFPGWGEPLQEARLVCCCCEMLIRVTKGRQRRSCSRDPLG